MLNTKVKQTPHEARLEHTLQKQISLNNRTEQLRQSAAEDARDLSPSQREQYINEEIRQYQKPEMIRQAIKTVKKSADQQKAKRDRQTREIKCSSKIKANLKTQDKVKKQSAQLAARSTFEQQIHQEGGMTKLFYDINISKEQLDNLPRKA